MISKEVRKINNILLINPRNRAYILKESGNINFGKMFPLGLAYVAAALEKEGYQVDIIDAIAEGFENRERVDKEHIRVGISDEQLINKVLQSNPDMVGITNLFSMQAEEVFYIVRLIKKLLPSVPIVLGGSHPSSMPEVVLENPEIDYVIIGEGEKAINELISRLNDHKPLKGHKGLGYRDEEGTIHINKEIDFVEDIDALPMPAYHLFEISNYFGKMAVHGERLTERFLPMITSRGCPMKCTFCTAHNVWGNKYRGRSPEKVIEEMEYLRDRYDVQEIIFEDDNITLSNKNSNKLFDLMINRKVGIAWTVPNGIAAFTITSQLLNRMKQAGCYKVNFAIESGSQRVLNDVIKKPLNLKKVVPLIKHCRKIGLDVGAFFILGMPGETLDEIRETFRFVRKNKLFSANLSIAVPLPGSKLYDMVVQSGYFVQENLNNSLSMLHPRSYQIQTPEWSAEQIENIIRFETARTKISILFTSPSLLLRFLTKNPKYVLKRFMYEVSSLLRVVIFVRINRFFKSLRFQG
ncbi:MAG: radical SAM protein [Candidatus Scalindua sp.]|jgi:anaerobic magnesium-protoporphyrin IX monomethyl ester cyclase|nr:radical SAM protein [Candidatus Scalindua sp.]